MDARKVFSAVITQGETAFIAYCPELGVTSQGTSEDDAIENLREAVALYLDDADVQEMLKKHPARLAHVTPLILPA